MTYTDQEKNTKDKNEKNSERNRSNNPGAKQEAEVTKKQQTEQPLEKESNLLSEDGMENERQKEKQEKKNDGSCGCP